MSWDSVIGQLRVKKILQNAITRKRVSHAYFFTGQEGIGKDAVAIEFAKALNCEGSSTQACDRCSSCFKFQTLQHPNVFLVFSLPVGKNEESGDPPLLKLTEEDVAIIREQIALKAKNPYHKITIPKANNIKINSIREIRRESSRSLFESGKRIFILFDVDGLNDQASNALLKTLEEPNDNTMFILTTAYPEKILPTIISRCQVIQFDNLSEEEIQVALSERERLEDHRAHLIARFANGNYKRAVQLVHSNIQEHRDHVIELLQRSLNQSHQSILQQIEYLCAEYQRSEIENLLSLLQMWLHDAMMLSKGNDRVVNADDVSKIRAFVAKFSTVDYPVSFQAVDKAISLLNKNVYIPLILIQLSIELRNCILSNHQSLGATAGR
ncbi:MAG TPA: DNA polymerase III subunit delta' [Bacteroidota bacterium]|nr:DNA polymerase III subunit delta' [Bacteroidota bacterium]